MSELTDLIRSDAKAWGCTNLIANQGSQTSLRKIPFSSPLLNWATYGGAARGRMIEIFGDEGSGKTTTAIDLCKNAADVFKQEYEMQIADFREQIASGKKSAESELDELEEIGPKKIIYIDIENTYDRSWADKLGLNNDDIIVLQPPNIVAEDVLNSILRYIETGEVGLIVADSIPALTPRSVIEKKVGERTVAALAGLLDVFCKRVNPLLKRYDCTLVAINQTRENMDNPYQPKTPGGKALKFYSSLRLWARKSSQVNILGEEIPNKVDDPAGYIIEVKIEKQKTGPHDRKKATFYLMCQTGIRPDYDYAKLAISTYGIIQKKGAWFTLCDPLTGEVITDAETGKDVKINGMAKVYDYLATNTEYYEKLKTFINNDINGVDENGDSESD